MRAAGDDGEGALVDQEQHLGDGALGADSDPVQKQVRRAAEERTALGEGQAVRPRRPR